MVATVAAAEAIKKRSNLRGNALVTPEKGAMKSGVRIKIPHNARNDS